MIFAPHTLQKKVITEPTLDEYGRANDDGKEEWITLCRCRCDDNTTKQFQSANGEVYTPTFHVVCEMRVDIQPKEVVRCVDNNDYIRGEGEVYNVSRKNYFNNSEIWI